MDYFYLTTNDKLREPAVLAGISYIHVKSKSDGTQTLVITEQEVNDPACAEKTKSEAQAILDAWIAAENQNPPFDVDNNEIIQRPISLEVYL